MDVFDVAFSSALMKWIWLMSRLSGKCPALPDFGLSGQVFISKIYYLEQTKAHKGHAYNPGLFTDEGLLAICQMQKCSKRNKSPLAKRQNLLCRVDIQSHIQKSRTDGRTQTLQVYSRFNWDGACVLCVWHIWIKIQGLVAFEIYELYDFFPNYSHGSRHAKVGLVFDMGDKGPSWLKCLAEMEKRADTADISVLFFIWPC